MRKEVEKLYNGITNIDDELVIEFDDSITKHSLDNVCSFRKAYTENVRKKLFKIMTLASVIIILFVAYFVFNDDIAVTLISNLDTKMGGNTETKIGMRDGEKLISLNAEEIANAKIDTSQFEKLNSLMLQIDYDKIVSDIERLIADGTEGFLLSNTQNISISNYDMYMIDLNEGAITNIAYEFIFSDSQVVGYIMFFLENEKLDYNISLNTARTYGYYFDFLENHQDISFLVLTDGLSSYFLSEENILYKATTGKVINDITIEGDCYEAFSVYGIDISYYKVIEQIMTIQKGENRNE